jgi:glycosyltransferase involved in cell wall biosynthesis
MIGVAKESQMRDFGHALAMQTGVSALPLVSIIISNYNYDNYLGDAVDSALGQTYSNVEVIVVDDGSSDGSREVVASYGDRIIAVLKENGGQASTCNVGYQNCRGEIVIFFDADDMLLRDTAERVVAAFQSETGVAKVQYRLQNVDASGKPTGEIQPPTRLPLHSGDLRQRLIETNEYTWPPTSGNAFAAEVLRQIMPIPEALCRGMPDIHLCNLSAVYGKVVSLEQPGVLYRIHGKNNYFRSTGSIDLGKLRAELLAREDNNIRKKGLFGKLYGVDTYTIGPRDMKLLRGRMIALKLDPKNYPFNETLWRLFIRGCCLAVTHPSPEFSTLRKLLYLLWFAGMYLSSKFLARALAEPYFSETKGWWYDKTTGFLRRL